MLLYYNIFDIASNSTGDLVFANTIYGRRVRLASPAGLKYYTYSWHVVSSELESGRDGFTKFGSFTLETMAVR